MCVPVQQSPNAATIRVTESLDSEERTRKRILKSKQKVVWPLQLSWESRQKSKEEEVQQEEAQQRRQVQQEVGHASQQQRPRHSGQQLNWWELQRQWAEGKEEG